MVAFTATGTNPSSGQPLGASAVFEQAGPGTNLTILLTNTSLGDVTVPTDVLTAVFFSLAGNPVLTPVSAVLANGSTAFYDPDGQPAGGVVGGEWAYKANLVVPPPGGTTGVSSIGANLFGPGDRFPGADLAGPLSPDGLQYGLLSAGDDKDTGNGGITGSGGLIKNAVLFTLAANGFTLTPSSVSDVAFQYGTNLSEPRIVAAVPEPQSLALVGAGLGFFGFAAARSRRRT
jgi:hypothetical protein